MGKIDDFRNAAQGARHIRKSEKMNIPKAEIERAARDLLLTVTGQITKDSVRTGAEITLGTDEAGFTKICINDKPCVSPAIKKAIASLSQTSRISKQCADYLIKNVQNNPLICDFFEVEAVSLLQLSSAPIADMDERKASMAKSAAENIIALSRYNKAEAGIIISEYLQLPEVMRNVIINDYAGLPKINVSVAEFIEAVESERADASTQDLRLAAERARVRLGEKFMDTVITKIIPDMENKMPKRKSAKADTATTKPTETGSKKPRRAREEKPEKTTPRRSGAGKAIEAADAAKAEGAVSRLRRFVKDFKLPWK